MTSDPRDPSSPITDASERADSASHAVSHAASASPSADQEFDYDLFVVGGGSGGVRAARWAAARGLKVGIAEGARLGGTCVNLGCVPKKLFFHAAHVADVVSDAAGFGWDIPTLDHDWGVLQEKISAYLQRLNGIYAQLLDRVDVTRYQGWASLADAHTLKIDLVGSPHSDEGSNEGSPESVSVSARHILLAPGGRPRLPALPGAEHASVSDDFFALKTRPRSALVIGGGYIGVELASVMRGLGVDTTLAFRGDQPLRAFDADIRSRLDDTLRADLNVISGVTVKQIQALPSPELSEEVNPRYQVSFERRGDEPVAPLEVELVLFAIGRVPNTHRLNLEAAGISTDERGAIIVDDAYRTNVPNIFAVGDVVDKLQLTPVALAEAMRVVDTIVGSTGDDRLPPLDYDLVPTAVFCHPNIGTVGLSEEEARARGIDITVYEADFKPLHQALVDHPRRVYMKLIVDASDDRVIGCHMIGDEAGEQIQGLAAAMQAQITKRQLDQTIGIHPTMAEEWVTMRTPRES